MSGIFGTMNVATKGLIASQTSLHTTGHNISNINTEGFTRQRVDRQADISYRYTGVGQLGTGVKMESVVRMIDEQTNKQIREENSTLNRFLSKSDTLQQLEIIFNEPSDTGLSENISNLFDSFQNLTKDPESVNTKTVVVENLKTLTETLNHMAKQIDSLGEETQESISKNVDDFNSKVEQLKTLNSQIFNISIKGETPNDLLDQRDRLLKDITAITEVDIKLDDYGRAGIKMNSDVDGKLDILTHKGTQKYLGYDKAEGGDKASTGTIKLYEKKADAEKGLGGNSELKISNGKLLGNMDALEDVEKAMEDLDKLANVIGQSVNRVYTENGTNGNSFIFSNKGASKFTAKNIEVRNDFTDDPSKLKASTEDADGDNNIALRLASLRNAKISIDENNDVGDIEYIKASKENDITVKDQDNGERISDHYNDSVIKIGVSKQHSDNMVENQDALTNQLEMRRESVSGVSINDEIADVVKFQKAYEANAKVISALTEMLDVLINRTGV